MNRNTIVVMTLAKTVSDKEADVLHALRDVAAAARQQPGCVEFCVYRSADDATTTINYERWVSEEARTVFLGGPDVEKFAKAIAGSFAESPKPIFYVEVG